jgi:hypothetical protein
MFRTLNAHEEPPPLFDAIVLTGLSVVRATWNAITSILTIVPDQAMYTPLPTLALIPVSKSAADEHTGSDTSGEKLTRYAYACPLFLTTYTSTDNQLLTISFITDQSPAVLDCAMVCVTASLSA